MKNGIKVREGKQPLLIMEGTEDASKLWLFDPKRIVFFCYQRDKDLMLLGSFQRQCGRWVLDKMLEPEQIWQAVTGEDTIRLLNQMENSVFLWARKRGQGPY